MKKQIKVAYFPSYTSKEKVLGSNGKTLDRYCIKCNTEEDLSTGNYILDATFLIENNLEDILQEEVILKVLLDYGYEIFRISKVNVGTRYIDVVARQITIADSLTLWLEDVKPTNLNGQSAATWMLDKAEGKKEIQVVSDIDAISTAYYLRMSLYRALHDNDNSFINRWGGEIKRRGYTVYINKRIGIDRGFTIREGKNLTGFECTSNIDKVVTRARGEGSNGILGNYVDSPLIGSYSRIYTGVIKYEDVKVKGENNKEGYDTLKQAQAELDRRIKEEYSKNGIDKIKANYTISFVQLEKTEEYKNYIVAERLFIGDDCRVYIPKLNVDIQVRAMSKNYDVLAQKTKEIKLSNYIEAKPLSLKQITEKLESIDRTETILQTAKDNATLLIKDGLKDSYVIVRENEIIIGDTKDINTMTNVWRWNNGGLGFSSTGYYGKYETAITEDGQIVATLIKTGDLDAALIKTGVITSYNGNVKINIGNDYIQVDHTQYNTRTKLDAEGFYIMDDNGETIASLASKKSWTELKADKVFANNIENIYEGPTNIYVNHNSLNIIRDGSIDYPFTSFYQLRQCLESKPIINETININVITSGNIDEQLSLSGLKGDGTLNIYFNKNFILGGKSTYDYALQMTNVDISVKINGGRTSYNSNDGAYFVGTKNGMMFVNCRFVQVELLCINSATYGVGFINTNGYTYCIDFCDTPKAIANTGGNVHDESSCGNCTNNYISIRAGITTYGGDGNGYKPVGYVKEQSGKVFEISARESKASFRTKPPVPPTIDTYQSFDFSDYGYYSELYGIWNANGKTVYQGKWERYGNNRGIFTFDNSEISNFLSNATILDGSTITLKREAAGGYSQKQTIYLCGTTQATAGGSAPPVTKSYCALGSLAWGKEETFNLPKDFVEDLQSGSIKSVMFYTSDGSNYIKFSQVCTLWLKVNK